MPQSDLSLDDEEMLNKRSIIETISTEILDNLTGRMTFMMILAAALNVAMGGNYAQKLPAIKGRAMWCNGRGRHKNWGAKFGYRV